MSNVSYDSRQCLLSKDSLSARSLFELTFDEIKISPTAIVHTTQQPQQLTPKKKKMAHNQVNEIDELLKDLKKTPGFKAYLILNSDGIVIRWDQKQVDQQLEDGGGGGETTANISSNNGNNNNNKQIMTYQRAVQHAHHITELYNKSTAHIKELFDPEDGPVENVRLRTHEYEMIVSSLGLYTLAVFQE